MFAVCGVSDSKFRTICSSVDKLDKVWAGALGCNCRCWSFSESLSLRAALTMVLENWLENADKPGVVLVPPFLWRGGMSRRRAQQSRRTTGSYAFFSSTPRGPHKWKGGREKCFSHGRFNIPNLNLLNVLLLMNQDHENLPPDWARALKSLFKCIQCSRVV